MFWITHVITSFDFNINIFPCYFSGSVFFLLCKIECWMNPRGTREKMKLCCHSEEECHKLDALTTLTTTWARNGIFGLHLIFHFITSLCRDIVLSFDELNGHSRASGFQSELKNISRNSSEPFFSVRNYCFSF